MNRFLQGADRTENGSWGKIHAWGLAILLLRNASTRSAVRKITANFIGRACHARANGNFRTILEDLHKFL